MKPSSKKSKTDRLELLALFEITCCAHELSLELGLPTVSRALSDAKGTMRNDATVDEYLARKEMEQKARTSH